MIRHPHPDVFRSMTVNDIIRAYADITDTAEADIVGKSQTSVITKRRHEVMFLIRELAPSVTYTTIGRFLGGRDMATVHEAVAKMVKATEENPTYRRSMELMCGEIRRLVHATLPASPPSKPWQLLAAAQVLRDGQMTDAEARKVALGFLSELEGTHG